VRNLSVTYRRDRNRVEALHDVSLDVCAGEVVAVVGESGSGKSTLALAMLGLLPRSSSPQVVGSIDIAGVSIATADRATIRRLRRSELGMVFQEASMALNPTMKVGRQLLERGASRQSVVNRLRECEVNHPDERLNQYAFQLSGGIAQRVMIAMSLAAAEGRDAPPAAPNGQAPEEHLEHVPRLLVTDEPTTALDATTRLEILQLMDRLRVHHRCGILFITHDLLAASRLADQVMVLYAGRMCEIGPAEVVLTRPAHRYTEALLAAQMTVNGHRSATEIPGQPPDSLGLSEGCPFAPRCASVLDICRTEFPELRTLAANHTVACFSPTTHTSSVELARSTSHDATVPAGCRRNAALGITVGDVLISVEDVTKSYRAPGRGSAVRPAVSHVSVGVRAGTSLAIVGESGSGKTTLLRLAAGLINPDSGSVRWANGLGRPQLIHQDFGSALTPWLSPRAQIAERLRNRGVKRTERAHLVKDLLAEVGLDSRLADARVAELSGGQRQRVVIARALASAPGVLLCDEPTSALDASLGVRVVALLNRLKQRRGIGLIVVTHDIALARYLGDDLAVMYRGEIVESGSTSAVIRAPKHPHTVALIEAATAPILR
jgi:peptide/nickel transport system ATP-binding protein